MFTPNSTTPHNRDTNKKLVKILHSLLEMDESAPFRKPVPHKALGLGDYKKIVKKPIDLNQIRRQNNQSRYKTIQEALDDIELCWENCKLYNHASSEVYQQALNLEKIFWKMVQENFPEIYASAQTKIKQVQANEPVASSQPPIKNENVYEASQSEPVIKQEKQVPVVEQSSEKMVEVEPEPEPQPEPQPQQSRNSRMQDELLQSVNEYEQNKSQKSQQKSQKQPIQVCLKQKPTKQNIQKLTAHMKQIQDKSILQQVLEILFTYEKENMVASPKGEMCFRIQNIHLSSFYRICRVVRLDVEDLLEIIQ